jgi:hypothetical protein
VFSLSPKAGNIYYPNSKAVRQKDLPLTQRKVLLSILFRPSTDWKRLPHIREGHLLDLI